VRFESSSGHQDCSFQSNMTLSSSDFESIQDSNFRAHYKMIRARVIGRMQKLRDTRQMEMRPTSYSLHSGWHGPRREKSSRLLEP
jgi:hypothetical protein